MRATLLQLIEYLTTQSIHLYILICYLHLVIMQVLLEDDYLTF